jgi:hypothetical protein
LLRKQRLPANFVVFGQRHQQERRARETLALLAGQGSEARPDLGRQASFWGLLRRPGPQPGDEGPVQHEDVVEIGSVRPVVVHGKAPVDESRWIRYLLYVLL